MTSEEQLQRQVEVLRKFICAVQQGHIWNPVGSAPFVLESADRIAAEPVEETDAEVVASLVERGHGGIGLDVPDGTLEWFDNLSEAAAWVRAQGVGNG